MNVVAIDGEAIAGRGYCLLQSSAGGLLEAPRPLQTHEVFEWLIEQGAGADRLVAYGLDYDVCHWLRGGAPSDLRRLAAKGQCWVTAGGQSYRIVYWPRSMFAVSRMVPHGGGKSNGFARVVDMAPWARKAFLPAVVEWDCAGENVAAELATMKALRGRFDETMLEEIRSYNETEVLCLTELYHAIHAFLSEAGLPCPSVLLPGAVASYLMRRHRVPGLPESVPAEVVAAAREAFRGGRMQVQRFGHFGRTLHYDMRSAYGSGLRSLPSLDGRWKPTGSAVIEHPDAWTLYRVAWNFPPEYAGVLPFSAPGSQGRFPREGEGWFWSPIVLAARGICPRYFRILEGWHQYGESMGRPFAYVDALYQLRATLPPEHPGQAVLKMLIVSTWGKLSQGPDAFGVERRRANPLWAGMVTSLVDAALYQAMSRRPELAIAAHVDGFFARPGLEVATSAGLGGWDCSEHDELLLIQSGRYWARQGDTWKTALQGETFGGMSADMALLAWSLDGPEAEATLRGETCWTLRQCADTGQWERLGEFLPAHTTLRFRPGKGRVEPESEEVYRYLG